jgi:hypothetical protein
MWIEPFRVKVAGCGHGPKGEHENISGLVTPVTRLYLTGLWWPEQRTGCSKETRRRLLTTVSTSQSIAWHLCDTGRRRAGPATGREACRT